MPATVSLFRPAAIESRTAPAAETLDVTTPWSWGVFCVAGSIIVAALLLGTVLRVEITGRARGAVVRDQASLRAVCFVRQGDRRFVHPGDVARIELDELPALELGTLPARVTRISRDPATALDVGEVLTDDDVRGAVYRVELEPLVGTRMLRPGMLLHARFVLRRERPLGLLFAPLRHWAS
jgi:hypothetical protein